MMKYSLMHLLLFLAGSIPIVALSWRSLGSARNHGFYRFFAWEIMLWILVSNIRFWFRDPLSPIQLLSWFLLLISVYPVADGLYRFRADGRIHPERNDSTLFGFEQTTRLIQSGIYRYIRHPMYSSLLLLNWGIALKNPSPVILGLAIIASAFLYLTVKTEERENLAWFGDQYRIYMKKTRMFLPWIW